VLIARDARGQPIPQLTVTIDMDIEGDAAPSVDVGRLSTRVVTTDAAGRAAARYTAPRAARSRAEERVVGIAFTPVGTDFATVARRVHVRLRPG